MAALGHQKILEKLRSGEIVISPLLSYRQLGAASVDLRMGNVVLVVKSRGASHVDPKNEKQTAIGNNPHEIALARQQKHQRYEIPFKDKILLHPGSLALVPTLEWVKLPHNMVGSVTARSTWAREGLSIATATLIEAGYEGIVTLELANLGEIPIALYPGMSLAQIAFFQVFGKTERPDRGQFTLSFEPKQGQIAKDTDHPFIP